jgi:hypothetical protein
MVPSTAYAHREVNREVTAIGGYYVLVKEVRLPFQGRRVLYVVRHAAFDTACCDGCAYALVLGFILGWKHDRDDDGRTISRVEPVSDGAIQEQIRRLIKVREGAQQVTVQPGGPV